MKKMSKFFRNPFRIIISLSYRGMLNFVPDKIYLKLIYFIKIGKILNLKNPETYNEKIQWLKLNDNNNYTNLVDKYKVREYVANIVGAKYLIPILGVYDNFNDIMFEDLPNKFVMKSNHDSGGVLICKSKKSFNLSNAEKFFKKRMKRNYFYVGREKPYKNIAPKILVEELLISNKQEQPLDDYKFFCFNGRVEFLFVATERGVDTKFNFFDKDFNQIEVKQHYKRSKETIKKPEKFQEMIKICEMLSANINHCRVDLYNINGKIYFGEITMYHFSGLEKFTPDSYDKYFGDFLELNHHV